MSSKYRNVDWQEFASEHNDNCTTGYTKETLLHSPIITDVIPNFKVSLDKPFRGLASTSFNDEADQYLGQKEDSQDVFDDDDDEFWGLEEANQGHEQIQIETNKTNQTNQTDETELTIHSEIKQTNYITVRVVVRLTSLMIGAQSYHLNAPVRQSCRVRHAGYNDDSLLLSLKSGFLLLLRLFVVPRSQNDNVYSATGTTAGTTASPTASYVVKPFIVQWWDLSKEVSSPLLESSGSGLASHRSGSCVVSTSASGVFRIYPTQQTKAGLTLLAHRNIPIDGFVLHSCFAEPLNDTIFDKHYVFMVLVFTNTRRLEINLFDWFSDSIDNISRTMLPLANTFEIPIMVIPSRALRGFLFIYRERVVTVTIHNIVSAEYHFSDTPVYWSFPTSWYRADTTIVDTDWSTEEILVATDTGVVYSLLVAEVGIRIAPVVRVADSVSVFSMEACDHDGFTLIYASDTGTNREVFVSLESVATVARGAQPATMPTMAPEIAPGTSAVPSAAVPYGDFTFDASAGDVPYSPVTVVSDFRNWSPLIDVQIVDAPAHRQLTAHSDQELWALTGTAKRTKLTHLRSGYLATRASSSFDSIRRASRLQFISYDGAHYLVCSLPFETVMLELQRDASATASATASSDVFVQIDNPLLATDATLLVVELPHDVFLQVCSTMFVLTDLERNVTSFSLDAQRIIDCHASDGLLAVLCDTGAGVVLEVLRVGSAVRWDVPFRESGAVAPALLVATDPQPSIVRIVAVNGALVAVVGTFGGELLLYPLDAATSDAADTPMTTAPAPPPARVVLADLFALPGETLVPNDVAPCRGHLLVGTRDGYSLEISCDNGVGGCRALDVGDSAVTYCAVPSDDSLVFVCCRTLWLLNLYDSEFPTRVFFDEKHDRATTTMAPVPATPASPRAPAPTASSHFFSPPQFAFVREDGLLLAAVAPFKTPCPTQVVVAEPAKHFVYLPHVSSFVVGCLSKDGSHRLKFIDRKLLKTVHYQSWGEGTALFNPHEYPSAFCVWQIKRNDTVSKKLIVGTVDGKKGAIKILDVAKVSSHSPAAPASGAPRLKVTALFSFDHSDPITHIAHIENDIIFSSGKSIYATSYSLSEKRLRPVTSIVTLASDVTSLYVEDVNKLMVTTKFDSVYHFEYIFVGNLTNQSENFHLLASDPISKSLVNQASVRDKVIAGEKLHSSIVVMDRDKLVPTQFSYKMTAIPRVFAANFNSRWSRPPGKSRPGACSLGDFSRDSSPNEGPEAPSSVLCVGVNGEVTLIRLTSPHDTELAHITAKLNENRPYTDSLTNILQKSNDPFIDKVTGKGLLALNKSYLSYKDNRQIDYVVDLDLDDIARSSLSKCCI